MLCSTCTNLFTDKIELNVKHEFFPSYVELWRSAGEGCVACEAISKDTKSWGGRKSFEPSFDMEEPLTVCFRRASSDDLSSRLVLDIEYETQWPPRSGPCCGRQTRSLKLIAERDGENDKEQIRLSDTMNSYQNAKLAAQWLQTCRDDHDSCCLGLGGQRTLPSRLLKIELRNGPKEYVVKLVNPLLNTGVWGFIPQYFDKLNTIRTDRALEYVALSHCWGDGKSIIKLTETTREGLYEGFSVSDMPRSFQDAVQVTQWLSIEYLWIDSLCIQQDSPDDWRKEAARMKDVYSNATVTIAATNASNPLEGFLKSRESSKVERPKIRIGGKNHTIMTKHWENNCWNIPKGPLLQRAWVLQEQVLSPRILHFGMDQMFWMCASVEASESFPSAIEMRYVPDEEGPSLCKSISFANEHWTNICEQYMECNLTFTKDRVMALAGIADAVRKLRNDRYAAGLWYKHFEHYLIWECKIGARHQALGTKAKYRAPSWSFLSVDSPIWCRGPSGNLSGSAVKVLGISIDLADAQSPTGEIVGGHVKMIGFLKPVSWFILKRIGFPDMIGIKLNDIDATICGGVSSTINLDGSFDVVSQDGGSGHKPLKSQLFLLLVLGSSICGMGLILQRTGSQAQIYERVGYFMAEGYGAVDIVSKRHISTLIEGENNSFPRIRQERLSYGWYRKEDWIAFPPTEFLIV